MWHCEALSHFCITKEKQNPILGDAQQSNAMNASKYSHTQQKASTSYEGIQNQNGETNEKLTLSSLLNSQ